MKGGEDLRTDFLKGIRDGIPICLGYLSVSFGFGILAVGLGLSILSAVGISLTNLTSAGQVAGVGIIAAGGSLIVGAYPACYKHPLFPDGNFPFAKT